jgi:hypothetical protein
VWVAVSCHLALGVRMQDSTQATREAFDLGNAQDMLLSMESDLGEGKGKGGAGDIAWRDSIAHFPSLCFCPTSACHKSCTTGKCIGPDLYQCTGCPEGRMLDPQQNMTSGLFMKYGMCTGTKDPPSVTLESCKKHNP